MKYLLITLLFAISFGVEANVLDGQWVYDSNKTVSDLKNNRETPEKVLKCFVSKACTKGIVVEFSKNKLTIYFGADPTDNLRTEAVDFQIIEKTENTITIEFLGEPVIERTYTVVDHDNIYYTEKLDGFQWIEYFKRKHQSIKAHEN